jgi:carboxyl-terminal processing protease
LEFGENTASELDENLKRLGENRMEGLILDLRDNPGGLLNAAVAVSDHFLKKGQIVVSHRGRSSPERVYYARNGNHGREYPIVVLVNPQSASAAEIVSGALQDHDRALILGQTTFGKGLVQTVYPLSDSTALALTTAHFYTPSGRLIQRDYSNISFYDYYFNHSGAAKNPTDIKQTDSGRTVYGGGGITPDEKYEPPKMDRFENQLYREWLFKFTRNYFAKHSSSLPKGWMPDAGVMDELHNFLLSSGVKFTEEEFTRDYDWTKRYLTKEIYIRAFDVDESDRVFAQTDPEVMKAISDLPKASSLVESAKKVMAQRSGR